ncbi:MAG: ACP S-malonyltransferase, partial [Spirochaetales bacterium]|nr:ACP S-malonyltransferase [Spirochaetales bacterium]
MDRNVFLCNGQGNQYYLMGQELYAHNPVFTKWMDKIDSLYKNLTGNSLITFLYNSNKKKSDIFSSLTETHPSLFAVQYALAMTLRENGVMADRILGVSLGEFVGLALADVITLKEALFLVVKQAECIISHAPGGSMIAVLENPDFYTQSEYLRNHSTFAGTFSPELFVISCLTESITEIENLLKTKSIVYQILPVDYGFHSPSIDSAAESFKAYAGKMVYQTPSIPYLSACTGGLVETFPKDHLWKAVRLEMRFKQTLTALQNNTSFNYIDLSPAGTLAGFIQRIIPGASSYKIMTPFDCKSEENLKNVFESIRLTGDTINSKRGNTMVTYVFPGQGSQKKGFGEGLFDEFKEYTDKADNVLGYSIKELCLEDPDNLLNQTEYTQPAIYVVNVLHYLKKLKNDGIKPDYVAGHSLGEYNALFAAEVFDFETGLKIVKARGRFMAESSRAGDGLGMAAAIGFDEDKINETLKTHGLSDIDVANYNSPFQIVLSGYTKDLERAKTIFEEAGIKMFIPLKVSSAFHSRYMENARNNFKEFIKEFTFSYPKIKVLSNVTARLHKGAKIKELLCEQIVKPVKWTESIRYLMAKPDMEFIEVGAGNVLKGLLARILKEATPLVVEDDEEEEQPDISPELDSTTSELPAEKNETEQKETTLNDNKADGVGGAITAESLGSEEFRKCYNIKYAYVSGAMYKGVASKELVVRMGKAKLLGFLGTGGMPVSAIEESIQYIQKHLNNNESYGLNLLCNINNPESEDELVDMYLKYGIKNVEAAAYMSMSPSLVRYRLKGLTKDGIGHRIIGKVSRPEVALAFLSPAPERIVNKLLEKGAVTNEQAELAKSVPMADDICVEADSGGHTDMGVAYVLMPAMLILRDEMMKQYDYARKVRVGAAGGLGTPEAVAAAIIMGAEFIVTGSINQCTVEAGTSDIVKDMLQQINVQDTEY